MSLKKRLGITFAGVAGVLVLASAAWACAVLATLSVDPGRARAGRTVEGFGGNYRVNTNPEVPQYSDVFVTLDGRDGPLVATVTPNPDRTISFSFEVPKVEPGWHVVMATQYSLSDGSPVAGTPGRDSLKVKATRRGEMVPVAWGTDRPSTAPEGAPATFPISSTTSQALLAIALLGLLAGGVATWRRQSAQTAA